MPNVNIDEIASYLEGTCKDISDVLPEGIKLDDLTQDQLFELDSKVLLCDVCGWWMAPEDFYEGNTCQECHDDGQDA
jgi:hypothetical protein